MQNILPGRDTNGTGERRSLLLNQVASFALSTNINCLCEPAEVKKYATDFGRLEVSTPLASFLPSSAGEIVSIVQFAKERELKIIARGGGYSQGGQSLAAVDGLVIDLSNMNRHLEMDQDGIGEICISCDAGVTLRQIAEYTIPQGFILPVTPFFLDLTIGGVLNVGGIGSAAHIHGPLVSNVLALEAVTAEGRVVRCSPGNLPELFHSLLGTCGQFGVITKAIIKLVPVTQNYTTHRYMYDSLDAWLTDYSALALTAVSNLQGACARQPGPGDTWKFLLDITVSDHEQLQPVHTVRSGVTASTLISTVDMDATDFANRYYQRFEDMRVNGDFEKHHPFLEYIVPETLAKALIEYAMLVLPLAYGDGFRLIYIEPSNLPEFFMVPDEGRICMLAILPTGIAPQELEGAVEAAGKLDFFAHELGAKRYLSGWLGRMEARDLVLHYGEQWPLYKERKSKFDPGKLFQSWFIHQGQT